MADNITNESILAPIPDITKGSGSIPIAYIIFAVLVVILVILIILYFLSKKKKVEVIAKKDSQQQVQQAAQPPAVPPAVPPAELNLLLDYIKNTRLSGFSDIQIKEALQKNGWSLEKIETAFKSV
jgi:flagellar basal body-associated protein FliL